MVPECKPEWNREDMMVFSRSPSLRRLQVTPPLQISISSFKYFRVIRIEKQICSFVFREKVRPRQFLFLDLLTFCLMQNGSFLYFIYSNYVGKFMNLELEKYIVCCMGLQVMANHLLLNLEIEIQVV